MRKITFIVIIAAAIFASCNNSNTSQNNVGKALVVAADTATIKYQCPMQCQGDTAYTTAGQCRVCEMDLEKK
ncbi:MAG: heavy metal-binding domain-containing protein [Bacteroidia bacterium]|nr:heavy metal-binding domain-containing protein [Bacteroidia bacterium]